MTKFSNKYIQQRAVTGVFDSINVIGITKMVRITRNMLMLIALIGLIIWLFSFMYFLAPGFDLVTSYLERGEQLRDNGKIIISATLMVLLYTVSELPIFLVAFGVGQQLQRKRGRWLGIAVTLLIIIGSYAFLIIFHKYTLHLLVPFIVTSVYFILVGLLKMDEAKLHNQAAILFQLMMGFQWFEINPSLHSLGFGKSEIVYRIASVIRSMEGEHILSFISLVICIPYLFCSIVTIALLRNHLLRLNELAASKKRDRELQQLRVEAIESRASQEMQTLVHDLKTPLTTIQGLISLVNMRLRPTSNPKLVDYTGKINHSVENLNEMISEILYEDVKRAINLRELMNYTKAQLDLNQKIEYIVEEEEKVIYVNHIRVVRAINNLVQNALEATQSTEKPGVKVKIFYVSSKSIYAKEGVAISVIDNGTGIPRDHLHRVWKERFSTKGTSGLGLGFVKNVAHSHQGWVKVNSVLDKGSAFTMFLPKGGEENDQEENSNY
ncbi:sensor histidine kinase [Bacillus horti]|uniref:histidine kinase n=1 Tax=Caldalkalibacillus horti TaxID=77523 RepID=A0ABT9VV47_9BACI|nr:HAMP domain-containing sensor histidine kinase [Bacillus horti]MDQ0164860.1 signal transduction histidine kinase [Bacillus horti]